MPFCPDKIADTGLSLRKAVKNTPTIRGSCADGDDIDTQREHLSEVLDLFSKHIEERLREINRMSGCEVETGLTSALADAQGEIEGQLLHIAEKLREDEHEAAMEPRGSAGARAWLEG